MRRFLLVLGGALVFLLSAAGAGVAVWARGVDVVSASADLQLSDPLAAFGADPPVNSFQDWETRRAPLLRAAFEQEIYGQMPDLGLASVSGKREIGVLGLPFARVEEWSVNLGEAGGRRFNMLVVSPREAQGPTPVIVIELFCSVRDAVPGHPEAISPLLSPTFQGCGASGAGGAIATMILGRYIEGPPFETVLARGYSIALFYPGDVVADDPALAPRDLQRIGGEPPAGALAVWARLYSKAYDVLAADPRFDASRIAIWGHSRHAKAALLAGAFDHRFWAIIAHQSGRFGAAPTANDRGEPRDKILERYAYWFTPGLTPTSPLSVDQHMLIALNAPTPLLLGNGAGDFWADPSGTWRAAQAASPVYRLFGADGFTQTDPDEPDFAADIVYTKRPAGHGVTTSDWNKFLSFLDAHRDRVAARR